MPRRLSNSSTVPTPMVCRLAAKSSHGTHF
jgi:hypothetical protein